MFSKVRRPSELNGIPQKSSHAQWVPVQCTTIQAHAKHTITAYYWPCIYHSIWICHWCLGGSLLWVVICQVQKLRVDVASAKAFLIEKEFVVTSVGTNCNNWAAIAECTNARRTCRNLELAATPLRIEVFWQKCRSQACLLLFSHVFNCKDMNSAMVTRHTQ